MSLDHRFDALAKAAAGGMPRRRLLKLAIAGAAGAALQPWAGVRRAFAATPQPCPPGYSLFSYYPFSDPPPVNGTLGEICVGGPVIPGQLLTITGQRLAANGKRIGINGFVPVDVIAVNGSSEFYARVVVNSSPIYIPGLDRNNTPVTFSDSYGNVRISGRGNGQGGRLIENQLVYSTNFTPVFLPTGTVSPSCPDGYTLGPNGCVPPINGGPPINGTAVVKPGSAALLAIGPAALGVGLYRRRESDPTASHSAKGGADVPEAGAARQPSEP